MAGKIVRPREGSTMPNSKRVLVFSSDPTLAKTRAGLVQAAGFPCEVVTSRDSALRLLQAERFDLVLLGREPTHLDHELEQRIREIRPETMTLKIEFIYSGGGECASRNTDPSPSRVVSALRELLGDHSPAPFH